MPVRFAASTQIATPTPTAATPAPAPRPSRLIAEALVQRHGPRSIVDRATRLGLPPQLTCAMVAACGATAVDPADAADSLPPSVH